MVIKILSWNIWIRSDLEKVKDFLRGNQADIIALQEVEAEEKRNLFKFMELQGYDYVFAPVAKTFGGIIYNDGPAIFTKLPIKEKIIHRLSDEDTRMAAQAVVEINDKKINLFSTHLIHTHQKPSDLQESQGQSLLKKVSAANSIVMGDFNASPDSNVVKLFQQSLVDSDPGNQPTWSLYTNGCSVCQLGEVKIRLDYIFATKDLKINSFEVKACDASDHLPVCVNLEI